MSLDLKYIPLTKMEGSPHTSCRLWRFFNITIKEGMEKQLDLEYHQYEHWIWPSIGICSVLGNILLVAIWHFERFWGDTQKRSLQNRLASQLVIACMLIMNVTNLGCVLIFYRLASFQVLVIVVKFLRGLHLVAPSLIRSGH